MRNLLTLVVAYASLIEALTDQAGQAVELEKNPYEEAGDSTQVCAQMQRRGAPTHFNADLRVRRMSRRSATRGRQTGSAGSTLATCSP